MSSSSHLCLSVTFLSPYFHGRRDGNALEWPPSPLRLFQCLVAAAAASRRLDSSRDALQWLEDQPPPKIVAPHGEPADGYRLSVPNNSMDVVARAWARGNRFGQGDANPSTHRTMKAVRYTRIVNQEDFPVAHYLWELPSASRPDVEKHVTALTTVSRLAVTLGWGIDMIAGHGRILSAQDAACLRGERWQALAGANVIELRVPARGTLSALEKRHAAWLNRLTDGGATFLPTPPLSVFETAGYARDTDQAARPFAAFSLRKPGSGDFCIFSTPRQTAVVAGMARHVAKLAAQRTGWTDSKIDSFVLGHGEPRGSAAHVSVGADRFAYLPLASIESRGMRGAHVVGDIRRLMLFCFAENRHQDIEWARRSLSGWDLVSEDGEQRDATLAVISEPDGVVHRYTRRAASWATVTPVVLPGYDDPAHFRRRLENKTSASEQARLLERLDRRVDGLLRRAMLHSGIHPALAAQADIECRKIGFWQGTQHADLYRVPTHLRRYPRLHVKIQWRDEHGQAVEIPGPICFGGGRFYGFGLFAAL